MLDSAGIQNNTTPIHAALRKKMLCVHAMAPV